MEILATVLRVASALLAWLFVIRYALTRFERSAIGVHIMGLTLIIALFMTLASYVSIFGHYKYFQVVGFVLYGGLFLLMINQHRLFTASRQELREELRQEHQREEDDKQEEGEDKHQAFNEE
jgi:Ca2+/Na+ antiporter